MDVDFLRATFNKLVLNLTWWVNRKDRFGKNVSRSTARWSAVVETGARTRM